MRIAFLLLAFILGYLGASPMGKAAGDPHPNPSRPLGSTSTAWIVCRKFDGVVYFLFSTPANYCLGSSEGGFLALYPPDLDDEE